MRIDLISVAILLLLSFPAIAAPNMCDHLPTHDQLKSALTQARQQNNGGLNNDMWGAVVARDNTVCAVVFTGSAVDSQWPGSRAIAIEKANTANSFSLKNMAFSTANLYAGSQPGGFLFGINTTSPVDTATMYAGPAMSYGALNDPIVGKTASGAVVFGGGLALYDQAGDILGALGVSGDTSCADHNIAWRTRNGLKLDYVPKGVAPDKSDAIIYDIHLGKSISGFGHPVCGNKEDSVAKTLPHIEHP
jgi:uncharacterized protein GlcG (DUF336 family)